MPIPSSCFAYSFAFCTLFITSLLFDTFHYDELSARIFGELHIYPYFHPLKQVLPSLPNLTRDFPPLNVDDIVCGTSCAPNEPQRVSK